MPWVMAMYAQSSIAPERLVAESRQKGLAFPLVELLELAPAARQNSGPIDEVLHEYDLLRVKADAVKKLLRDNPESLRLRLPSTRARALELTLVRVDPLAPDFAVYESGASGPAEWAPGAHYRGVIEGEEGSVAAISIFEEEIVGLASAPTLGNLVLGRLSGAEWEDYHVLYNDEELGHLQPFHCAAEAPAEGYSIDDISPGVGMRGPNDCVRIYFEVDHDIFQNKGGTAGAVNYVTALFNEVATLYANDNMKIIISEIFVWSTPSPYDGSNSSRMLSQFQAHRTSFNGDLAQLLSYKASGGIAVLNGFCRSNPAWRMSFSSIGSSFRTLPNYSFTVMVVAHELGHLFGSHHTHACVWNGNNTAIDGCAGSTEGSCPNPGVPSEGGTIMSYCHLTSRGVNFSLGFGPQPGNVMRNRLAAATCLQSCPNGDDNGGGGDNGGGDDNGGGQQPCAHSTITLSLILDNYGSETTWSLRNSAGALVASGGPYNNGAAGQTIRQNFCLPDDCYRFEIRDSYGDGICCGYGNGSYTLKDAAGKTIAAGGRFGASERVDFCVGAADPDNDCQGQKYFFSLTLDDYGRETTWSLKTDGGQTLYSGGPYSNKQRGRVILDTFCLAPGCYVFEILDSYGDGICCRYGNGNFTLIDDKGMELASGGNYGAGRRVSFCTAGGDGGKDCVRINFNEYSIDSYGGNQDEGIYRIGDNGNELLIQDNAWKSIPLSYAITSSTVLEFDFRSTIQGEIHGVGFNNKPSIDARLTFKLFGTQRWGILNYNNYPGDGAWKSYAIPVGRFYTGQADRLFFVADHDAAPKNGNSFFRNVRIHEGQSCGEQLAEATSALVVSDLSPDALLAFPNPARGELTLRFLGKEAGSAEVSILSADGRLAKQARIPVNEGENVGAIDLGDLPAGMYLLRMNDGVMERQGKIAVAR
jgi:hypothetical protein